MLMFIVIYVEYLIPIMTQQTWCTAGWLQGNELFGGAAAADAARDTRRSCPIRPPSISNAFTRPFSHGSRNWSLSFTVASLYPNLEVQHASAFSSAVVCSKNSLRMDLVRATIYNTHTRTQTYSHTYIHAHIHTHTHIRQRTSEIPFHSSMLDIICTVDFGGVVVFINIEI